MSEVGSKDGQAWAPAASKPLLEPEIHWEAGSAYLLPTSDQDVRITPYRPGDDDEVDQLLEVCNHPQVGKWDYDHTTSSRSDIQQRITSEAPKQTRALEELRTSPLAVGTTLPFSVIRISGRVVGHIYLWLRRPPKGGRGDDGVYGVSYALHPESDRDIGREVVACVLGWAASRMGIRRVEAIVESGDTASTSLLQSLDFTCVNTSISSTGGTLGIWQRDLLEPEVPWIASPAPNLPVPLVQWETDEPFIQILPEVRITPYRPGQAEEDGLMELCNQPGVAKWSYSRASPFERSHAKARLESTLPNQRAAINLLRENPDIDNLTQLPFSVIRDPGGRYIGDFVVRGLPSSDRFWVGYSLHPDFHSRGIGTAVMKAVLAWSRVHMGARRLEAHVETANPASYRLLQKLGFIRASVIGVRWPEDKGGGWREVGVWQREFE